MHTKCPLCGRRFTRKGFDSLLFSGFQIISNDIELELRTCTCAAKVSIEIKRGLPGNYMIRKGQPLLTYLKSNNGGPRWKT